MSQRKQMVCRTCGSSDVRADAYAAWNKDLQEWELSSTYDKGSACEVCEGECRIDEVPLADWEAQQNEPQELEGKEYRAEKLEDGSWKAIIVNKESDWTIEAFTDQWGSPFDTRDEALDECRRKIMQEEYADG